MNSDADVIELKRQIPVVKLADFLDEMSEDELLSALEEQPINLLGAPRPCVVIVSPLSDEFETNTRLTIIRMFEEVPEMEQPFSFRVGRYRGAAYVQAMRSTLAKVRKMAKDQNYELGEPFRMMVVAIETQATCDIVTVKRIPKGKKYAPMMENLAQLLGGHKATMMDDED